MEKETFTAFGKLSELSQEQKETKTLQIIPRYRYKDNSILLCFVSQMEKETFTAFGKLSELSHAKSRKKQKHRKSYLATDMGARDDLDISIQRTASYFRQESDILILLFQKLERGSFANNNHGISCRL
ncbi:hypothetical protein CDAR_5801 [Caerostris darwini]|uniref:Uncharacterized protein n=1 Tax=Caerostris darwini TaxID=1538125 RepID=A0AAV4RFY5_9ARAC|nr:hypothetical protein CDAR_5801 [Caerostris darwini]